MTARPPNPTVLVLKRPDWDEYFLDIAQAVSRRASCPRASIGAVIVDPKTKRILATGYNGAPSGERDCFEAGCLIEYTADGKDHCVRTVHAEANAILSAARHGVSIQGAIMYNYGRGLCERCVPLSQQAGIIETKVRLADPQRVTEPPPGIPSTPL